MRRSERNDNPYRLSPLVVPHAYRLRLEPDLVTGHFEGRVEIDLDVEGSQESITLNAVDLTLDPARLHCGGGELVSTPARFDERFETATFDFGEEIPLGPATLTVEFRGELSDQLAGFYRSTFRNDEGVEHTIATTQLASTDARRAFPCFDDPALKATFELTLVVAEDLLAVSNSAETSSVALGDGRREIRFAPTMVMSSYLVAFVIGPYGATPVREFSGVPCRVIYRPGQEHLTEFALDALEHALAFFTEYFDRPYPGDKLDLVAVPDFAAGAMENLGCITFREDYLIIDPEVATEAELRQAALVVNHEVAHMWFGDLVTMDWWEGIWLNEAFATFMEALCSQEYRPDWKRWVNFTTMREGAYRVDAQHSTRPIEYPVVSPDECRAMFDPFLTYAKGCAVLRMLEQYLGEATFRDGIRLYLARHAYDNTVTADLWAALEEASGEPVGDIMNTWILQGGYPLLRYDGETLSQTPVMFRPASGPSGIGASWRVPVRLRTLGEDGSERVLLEGASTPLVAHGATVINAGGNGFYRIAYSPEQLRALAERLGELDESERAVLVGDAWASVQLGQLELGELLGLARGLTDFDEPMPWEIVARVLAHVDRVADDAARDSLAAVTRVLFGPLAERLGWEPGVGEDPQIGPLRAAVLRTLGTIGRDEDVAAEAARRFDANEVSGDLADAIVTITMHQGRPGDAEVCRARRLKPRTPQEEVRYLWAPAASRDPEVVLGTFEDCFESVRTQDAPYLVGSLMANLVAGKEVFRRLSERWSEAVEKFPEMGHSRMIAGLEWQFDDPAFAARARAFVEANPMPAAGAMNAMLLDVMDANVAWAARTEPTLAQTLDAFLTS